MRKSSVRAETGGKVLNTLKMSQKSQHSHQCQDSWLNARATWRIPPTGEFESSPVQMASHRSGRMLFTAEDSNEDYDRDRGMEETEAQSPGMYLSQLPSPTTGLYHAVKERKSRTGAHREPSMRKVNAGKERQIYMIKELW